MTKRNIDYVVKVLSGINQGATAELPDESGVVIGRSAACDIIFSGASVADRHVAVELDGGRIRLTPLAQPVYIDGKDVGLREVILRPNQLVNIGVVDFTIADKRQPWPDYDPLTKKLAVANEPDESGGIFVGDGEGSRTLLGNPWLWLAIVAMLLANVQYLSRDYGGIPGLLGVKKTVSQELVDVIDAEKYPGLYVKRTDSRISHIRGYVTNLEEKNRVEKQVARYGGSVATHIFVDTELEDNARKIARSLGEDEIVFTTLEHGRLKASGLAESRRRWLNIKESIRNDVQGVTSINDDEVKNLYEMFAALQSAVKKEKFADRLDVSLGKRTRGMIVAKGKLTEEEKSRWVQIKKAFLEKSDYPFKFREIIRRPDADIKLSIRSVSVGEIPFVVSKEGDKYFQGSHVGSGYYIDAITDDHILLKNNNISFPVYFGQEKEQ